MIDITNYAGTCKCCGTPLKVEFYIPWNPDRHNAVLDGQKGVALVHCPNRATCELPMFSIPVDEYDALFNDMAALAKAKASASAGR